MKVARYLFILFNFWIFSSSANSIDLPPESEPSALGIAIAEETDRRNLGFTSTKSHMEMVLTNQNGDVSSRRLRMNTLENKNPEDGDWNLIVFDEPRDIKGAALLTYAHILDPDDQWFFLPALKRVKRISSTNKSGPFMGSEFAFEDFSSQEVGKYSYRWLRDEPCGDRTCHVVERRPLYKHSGYTRMVAWTEKIDYQLIKVDFYDRKNELLKTLTLTEYRLYLEKYWRAHDLYMVNHVSNKTTRLTWTNYDFQAGLTEKDFSQNSLKRTR